MKFIDYCGKEFMLYYLICIIFDMYTQKRKVCLFAKCFECLLTSIAFIEAGEISENTPQPDIFVKEWVYNRSNPYQTPEQVKAEPLPWAVPTLQRLWFGPSLDDKRRRMRALLSCLNSDTPLILNVSYVPQHMLVMACVLRYIMSQGIPILRRQELDAFLCQAFSPDLMNAQYLQELTVSCLNFYIFIHM
jgi:hypothetical protein